MKGNVPEEYAQRLEYELGVINPWGLPDTFLIVAGIIGALEKAVNTYRTGQRLGGGVSRGVESQDHRSWTPYGTIFLFERFLNPERISMPDIDTDVSTRGG